MVAILQRKSSGGIIFVIITKFITKENVPRNYFVILSARMVCLVFFLHFGRKRGPNIKGSAWLRFGGATGLC